MCRLLVLLGSWESLEKARGPLVASLARAADSDPHGGALFGPDGLSHRDGWGFVRVVISGGRTSALSLGLSTRPIFEDPGIAAVGAPERIPGEAGVIMVHARAASRGMPVNVFSTHPAEAVTSQGYRLFVVHNGTVDKDAILEDLGVDPGSPYARRHNDTYFLARLLASMTDENLERRLIEMAARHLRTALNAGFLLVKEGEVQAAVGSLYMPGDKPPEREKYYRLYEALREDLAVYSSSTLVDYYDPGHGLSWRPLPNGLFKIYRLRGERPELLESFSAAHGGGIVSSAPRSRPHGALDD